MYYYLHLLSGVDAGALFPLGEGSVSIGRSPDNAVRLSSAEKSVSAHHAILYRFNQRFSLQDLSSTNGTFVNDTRIDLQDINPEDSIGLGKRGPRLKLLLSATPLSALPVPPPTRSECVQTLDEHRSPDTPQPSAHSAPPPSLSSSPQQRPPQRPLQASAPQGATVETEQQLRAGMLDKTHLHALLLNPQRIEWLAQRGALGQSAAGMLRTMQTLQHASRRGWMRIVLALAALTLMSGTFFIVKSAQYHLVLHRARALERRIDGYELQIAALTARENAPADSVQRILKRLHSDQRGLQKLTARLDPQQLQQLQSDPLEQAITMVLQRFGEDNYHIPPQMLQRVAYHLDNYRRQHHPVIGRFLARRDYYFAIINPIFAAAKLPPELAYVAMLESGFDTTALSPAGARGLWQFMPQTAIRYGLVVNDTVDERCDARKATRAAAEYFTDLIALFGAKSSIMLSLAAYNAGEGRIGAALRKIDDPLNNRDFWHLYRMGYLAQETNEYIPRIIALIVLAEQSSQQGLSPRASTPPQPHRKIAQEDSFLRIDY